MTLEELSVGYNIKIEVTFGTSIIEFDSVVLGSDGPGIYAEPYMFKGNAIDFAMLGYSDLAYNVYFIDENGMRNAWKNVEIQLQKYGNSEKYLIHAKSYLKFARPSERRGENRLVVDIPGTLSLNNGTRYQAKIHDISDTGISFYSDPGRFTKSDIVQIDFFDVARENSFRLTVKVRIVRVDDKDGKSLYGGTILLGKKEVLGYICLKRMENKVIEAHRKKL